MHEGTQMKAVVLDRFGDVEALRLGEIPVPQLGPDEVLIRVQVAGVGEWDPFEREGGYAQMMGVEVKFPYVLGSEGAGVIAEVGSEVTAFKPGDAVYAIGFLNPKGGFYAEYVAVRADLVAPIPRGFSVEQAGVMGGVGITALRGIDSVLGLQRGQAVMVTGANGGVGHLAVQLAKRRGARVLAVASGADGIALAAQLGADAAVDGRTKDVLAAAHAFAPDGLDAALVTASDAQIDRILTGLREGAIAAYPNGVAPAPAPNQRIRVTGYNGEPDATILGSFQREIHEAPIHVHVARTFPLDRAADAHRATERHHLGKLALRIDTNHRATEHTA